MKKFIMGLALLCSLSVFAEINQSCETQKFLAGGDFIESNMKNVYDHVNRFTPMIVVGACQISQSFIDSQNLQIYVRSNGINIFFKKFLWDDREKTRGEAATALRAALNDCGCTKL